MNVEHVMTEEVATVAPDATVQEVARLFLDRRISGAPVVDESGALVGIVSEGDLVRRAEIGTETDRSWWLDLLTDADAKRMDYVREHGLTARRVMTRDPVTIVPDAPLAEAARLLERRRVKRLPVLRDGRLVGIVSRANLLRGLVAAGAPAKEAGGDDARIRAEVRRRLAEAEVGSGLIDPVVRDGVVQLWGVADSDAEREAAVVAAESAPGVRRVESHLGRIAPWAWGV